MNKYLIIDFDSTFIKIEALDKLSEIALEKNPKREKVVKKIKEITNLGMEGEIPFHKSLNKRLSLFKPNKKHILELISFLKANISSSFEKNKGFFRINRNKIYIVSGRFKEYIEPVVKNFGIDKTHVLANTFVFDKNGNVRGYLPYPNISKTELVKTLNLKGKIIVIGDGITDYKIKEKGIAKTFIAFTENVKRNNVVKKADYTAESFDDVLKFLKDNKKETKRKKKVLLLENIDKKAEEIFKEKNYEIRSFPYSLPEKELLEILKDVDVLGIRSKTKITKNILRNSTLKTIGVFSIGTDNVDISECSKRNIHVLNAPFSNTRSVAELVIGEIIMLSRQVFRKNSLAHNGYWEKSSQGSFEIRGKKLGIIGYGNIGSQVSVLAEAFGMQVFYYDIKEKLSYGNAKKVTLKELFKISDFITIHIDGRLENTNFIGEKEFKLMKNGVIFLNLSRGHVVDINALYKYLKNGKIKGAAIDVYQNEPSKNGNSFVTPLQGLDNVILTPHIGGATEEAQRNIAEFVAGKIVTASSF